LEIAFTLGGHLLHMAGEVSSVDEGIARQRSVLQGGQALEKFRQFVVGQGGDPAFIDNLSRMPHAPVRHDLLAQDSGYISLIDAENIGRASLEIGAGRAVKEAEIDHSVGFVLHAKVGDRIEVGTPLATLHAATLESAQSVEVMLRSAFAIGAHPVEKPPTIREIVQ
jgi:pyrimidine-nucleoside phosphorylase